MTSKASICSVTRIVPILEVIYEPTFPAIMMEVKVGANSNITDCLVAKPIRLLGKNGLFRFKAVCMVTTPPIKKAIKMIIPREPNINSSISFKIRDLMIGHLVGFLNTSHTMMKYFPIASR